MIFSRELLSCIDDTSQQSLQNLQNEKITMGLDRRHSPKKDVKMIFIKLICCCEWKWHLDLSVVTLKCFHLKFIIGGKTY